MGSYLIRIGVAVATASLLAGCKGTGEQAKASKAGGGLFGWSKKGKDAKAAAELEKERAKRRANGLGDPSWQNDVNRAIGDARSKLPGFDPSRAPRRNPDIRVPVDPNRARSLTYSKVPVNGPYVAMTFDDGPHPTNTPRLLDMLRARNIRATFFVVGTNARRYPHIIRRMIAEGHEVANHTVNHPHITKISEGKAREEVAGCERAIVEACGVKPRLFRPPGGYINNGQKIWLKDDFGYSTVMWSVDPQDWRRPGSGVVAQRILSNTDPGDIILVHDIHSPSIAAMPQTLDGLLGKGFRFVTVSQLVAMEGPRFAKGGAATDKVVEPKPFPSADADSGTAQAKPE